MVHFDPLLRMAHVVLALLAAQSSLLAQPTSASLRLGARYSIGEDQVRLSNPAKAGSLKLPCDVILPTLRQAGDTADYAPEWGGRGGIAEILVRRWRTPETLDRDIVAEIHHRGEVAQVRFDANTQTDDWHSLGRFSFDGSPGEFVRVRRTSDAREVVTPALGMRFDVYYDTKPRTLSEVEANKPIPPGFSTTGEWSREQESSQGLLARVKGAAATWNPMLDEPGIYGVYVYKPNVSAADGYEIWHSGQVDHIDLRDVVQSNAELGNPRAMQGWYKVGEFEFDGKGAECLRVVKTSDGVETRAGDVYFERLLLDGTLLHRWLVPVADSASDPVPATKPTMRIEEKIRNGAIAPGFTPQSPAEPSSKLGATAYARPLYLRSDKTPFRWNPCLVVPGTYDIRYYTYWPVKADGEFRVFHQGKMDSRPARASDLKSGDFFDLGSFQFAGDGRDEFVEMTGIDRASEVVFERKTADGLVRHQTWVTVHPCFREARYVDTAELSNAHDISVMVLKGVLDPIADDRFEPDRLITVEQFADALARTVRLRDTGAAVTIQGLPDLYAWDKRRPIQGYEAAALCDDALALVGRYTNVTGFGAVNLDAATKAAPELKEIPAELRFGIVRLAALEIAPLTPKGRASLMMPLTRGEAASILKNILEQGLSAGPPLDSDWELSFQDEFNTGQVDWSKWMPRHGVRFKGYSAIWAENCSVRDGTLYLTNFMDNRKVPYSSGSLTARQGQVYGFFEARHNYPNRAYGSHTSFWFSLGEKGDFNVNEGTYPNHISNNNYFMTSKEIPELKKGSANFNNFSIDTNFAHDLHTISGFLDEKNLFYALDGQITYAVQDYPRFYADATKTTNIPYAPIIGSVITFFDGPLDRDRIDGSSVMVDWVRSYRKSIWSPALAEVVFIVDTDAKVRRLQIRFDKRMKGGTVTSESVSVLSDGDDLDGIQVQQITPSKYWLILPKPFPVDSPLDVRLGPDVVDERGRSVRLK